MICAATPADVDALITLSRRTIRASYRSFLGDAAVDAFIGGGAADRYVLDHVAQAAVIEADGRIAGFAVCRGDRIDLMMIDAGLHGRGLGTRLLAHCEEALFSRHDVLKLESFEDNAQANGFYRRRGWEEAGRLEDGGIRKIAFRKRRPSARA